MSTSKTFVKVQNLRRDYRVGSTTVAALRGINLEIQTKELVAITGVSGSGKSTLLHLLGGLDTPTDGTVRVGPTELTKLSSAEQTLYRRQVVGFVFQSFHLISSLTALGNVELGLLFRRGVQNEKRAKARLALERVGLSHRFDHRPHQLSGGEQQRVAIARAIVHGPALILADEPTGNLDRENAEQLLTLLDELRQSLDTTIVIVTHDEALSERFADRRVRLVDGCVEDVS